MCLPDPCSQWRSIMLDVIMLAVGCGFFAAAILYTISCDRI